jgi:hypothetical protein
MTGYWFRNRTFGWGWTPISIEGWISSALLVLFMYIIFKFYGKGTTFWALLLITIGMFVYFADSKTNEKVLFK